MVGVGKFWKLRIGVGHLTSNSAILVSTTVNLASDFLSVNMLKQFASWPA